MSKNQNNTQHPEIWAIVAMGKDGAIGRGNDMPWHLPEDLKHFKQLTLGHPVIMGRRTWESLPFKPLPGRLNIVLTRDSNYIAPGAEIALSLQEALNKIPTDSIPFIIGGANIYSSSIPLVSRLFITRIDTITADADAFFPHISDSDWNQISLEGPFTSKTGLNYTFEEYERIDNK